MNAVMAGIDGFLETVRGYAESVDSEVADRENDFRSMCFWNIHNRALLTKEILTFYMRSWEAGVPEGTEGEMTERVVTVTRDMFIDTVSSIEKASKDCVKAYPKSGLKEKAMDGMKYLYLRNIIGASAELGYINDSVMDEWDGILTMRNLVTHNNSVADRSKVFEIGDIRISMRPNRMMKGPADTFVVLTDKVTRLFYDWLITVDVMFG